MQLWPLPVAHSERATPLDFIPQTPDPAGAGERMWRVLARFRISQGPLAGKTFGECAPAWQEAFVRALYGATDAEGKRLFDEALLLIAKKNGKSTLTAAITLAHVLAFPEERGEAIVLADTRTQARLVFDSAAAFIRADPWLMRQFAIREYVHKIEHLETRTAVRAIASELAATVGTAPSFYIVDEVHLLGLRPQGAKIVRQLSSGAAVRKGAMGIYITTAPVDRSAGIYDSLLRRARRVIAGEAPKDRLFPVLFEIPPGASPDDPRYWWMPNPSMGVTFPREWFEREHGIATTDPDPSARAHFYSQHLNVPMAESVGYDVWLPSAVWDKCRTQTITLEELRKRCGRQIWVGVDAGGHDDMTAMGVLGETPDHQLLWWGHQWLHRDAFNAHEAVYRPFMERGELTVIDEDGADIAAVKARVTDLGDAVVSIGVDPYGLRELLIWIEQSGLTLHAIPQGWRLSPHIRAAERLVRSGKFACSDDSLMAWNVGNAALQVRGGAVAITKPWGNARNRKIDGVITFVLAVAVWGESMLMRGRSIYDERDVRRF